MFSVFRCSRTKFEAIIANIFDAKFLLDRFTAFGELFMTLQVTFSCFFLSFLSYLNCSHSEVKFVAKVKAIVAEETARA